MMNKKFVRYNGQKNPYCISNILKEGNIYEVEDIEKSDFRTDYILKGVEGVFNSCMFDTLEEKSTYICVINELPVLGQRARVKKIIFSKDGISYQNLKTSSVEEVKSLGNNVFSIKTKNSLYVASLI